MKPGIQFESDDHRQFNRDGAAFDAGETFSGVDFERGLEAVEALRPHVPPGMSMAELALRWILMFDEVSCVIPGARHPHQVEENAAAAEAGKLPGETMAAAHRVYQEFIQAHVHHRW